MIDHQLDPLLEVIRSWVYDIGGGTTDGQPDYERGKLAVDACRAGLKALLADLEVERKDRLYEAERERLAAAGLPDPIAVDCPYCEAFPHERCWTSGSYRTSRPHNARVAAATKVLEVQG